jgi:hypothetical protein
MVKKRKKPTLKLRKVNVAVSRSGQLYIIGKKTIEKLPRKKGYTATQSIIPKKWVKIKYV